MEVGVRLRARVGLGMVVLVAMAMFVPAVPAAAADTAPLTIASTATPTAVNQDLTIDTLKVTNNTTAAVTAVDVRFDLVRASQADPWPFDFGSFQTDAACPMPPTSPAYELACHYTVQIAAGATVGVAVKLEVDPTTDSATAPTPELQITVGTGTATDTTTVPIDRVKRVADLGARVTGQLHGRVGDIVNLQWIVSNKGPDSVGAVGLILIAPPGTEWTGATAAECNPAVIPKTKYECISASTLAPGHTVSETWQLKIDSATVGTGQFTAVYDLRAGSPDPYVDITDPNMADNTVNFTVSVDTTTPGRVGNPSPGAVTPTPTATAAIATAEPTTTAEPLNIPADGASPMAVASFSLASSNGVLLSVFGVFVLIGIALAGLVTYRRRVGRSAVESDDARTGDPQPPTRT
jgi:hypothetical protein